MRPIWLAMVRSMSGMTLASVWPSIRIAGQRFCMQRELAALAALQRGGDRHLDAELVRSMRLALADALDLRRMQAPDLAAALALPVFQNGRCLIERPFEDRLRFRRAGDLA